MALNQSLMMSVDKVIGWHVVAKGQRKSALFCLEVRARDQPLSARSAPSHEKQQLVLCRHIRTILIAILIVPFINI